MHLSNRIYAVSIVIWAMGWLWLSINLKSENANPGAEHLSLCPVKKTTGFACPSCGTTRAISKLSTGDIKEAILINPLSIIASIALILMPGWLLFDLVLKRKTYLKFYRSMEKRMQNPLIAFSLIGLVLLNWIWNISKGL